MIAGRRVTVVVPAYREEGLIGRTLDGIPGLVDRVIVVDDASPDRTGDLVRAREEARVHLLRRNVNGGVGAAIRDGYREFLAVEGDPEAVCVVMAGDAQMDPSDLPPLLEAVCRRGAGYAKGNRLAHPGTLRAMPAWRLLGNLVFSMLTRPASGYWHVTDSQCGYTAITRAALARTDLRGIYCRYGFPNDLLVRLNLAGVRVADVPVRAVYGEEISGINPWTTVPRITALLLRRFLWRVWRKHLLQGARLLGLAYLLGLLLLTAAAGMWLVGGQAGIPGPLVSGSLFCLLGGLGATLLAVRRDVRRSRGLMIVR